MSQPQTPPQWYPPPQSEKKGLSSGAIIAVVVAVVVVVIIVGGVLAVVFLTGVQQAANLSAKPNIAITNEHSTYTENCGVYGSQTTTFDFSATLVNTGCAGYVDIAYDVNDVQVTANTYYVSANSQLPISDGVTVNACYGSAIPTFSMVLLSERSA